MFNNAGHALDWAYNMINRPIVKMSAINRMRQAPAKGTPNELLINFTVQELHGQAAQIITMIDRLSDQAEREFIRARFGRELSEDDIRVLVYRGCEALGVGLGGQQIVYRVMHGYFTGKNMPYRAIRRMLSCRDQYALAAKSCLYEVLDRYHDRAMADMKEVFEQHGLIRVVSSYA